MRLATFNIESLDLPPRAKVALETRAALLRPALERVAADILCLQEVNGQRAKGSPVRTLAALDQLLAGTRYASYYRASTRGPDGRGVGDLHNLVTLSRLPIIAARDIRNELVAPPLWQSRMSDPPEPEPHAIGFDRPLLLTEHALENGAHLSVLNVHLRAPLASGIPGQKIAPFVWRSIGAWAEGFFVSAMKRAGQAAEIRITVEQLIDEDPGRLIAVAGDFNAEDHDTALKIAVAAEEDTGNGALAARSLVVLDRALAEDRRWSVLHHGRPQMLDHILVSRTLFGRFRTIEVHNESVGDEAVGYAKVDRGPGSYHAAVVAEFTD